ncbi:hypothetical protein PMF13cell1_02941 [Blautia producta]|uniref:Uncharacterized protein n=1 Tax=Blautia producta TaxID=33035 RepID=A0A4P6M003_9FIRM|nr:hypothetical protein PMF13cell1_02941 [Blautia producta]
MMAKIVLRNLVKEERLRHHLFQNSFSEQAHVSLRTILESTSLSM